MARQNRSERETGGPIGGEGSPAPEGSERNGFVPVTPYGGEELVADARHGVTPGQMVARKVLDLLGGGNAGLVAQAGGRSSDPRRVPEGLP